MEIIIRDYNGERAPMDITARHAAALVMEGCDIWATDKAWARINKRGHGMFGTSYCYPNLHHDVDYETNRLLMDMDVADIMAQEGGVDELWGELEMLDLVHEWDEVEERWT